MSDITWITRALKGDDLATIFSKHNTNMGVARQRTWRSFTTADDGFTCDRSFDFAWVNVSSGPMTIYLPASPTMGDKYVFQKEDATTNLVTIDGNGKRIDGSFTPFTFNDPANRKIFTWSGDDLHGWIPYDGF